MERGAIREDGQFTVTLTTDCQLFAELEEKQEVFIIHTYIHTKRDYICVTTFNDAENILLCVLDSGGFLRLQ